MYQEVNLPQAFCICLCMLMHFQVYQLKFVLKSVCEMCSFISMAAPNAVRSDCTLCSTDLISLFIAFDSLPLHCVRHQNLGVPYVLLQLSLNLVKLWLTLKGRGSSICSGLCCRECPFTWAARPGRSADGPF